MRTKDRMQHYVSRDVRRKARALAAANGVTESSVTDAALAEYVDRDRTDKDWLTRRLDLLSHQIGQLQSAVDQSRTSNIGDAEMIVNALGVFIRHVYLPAVTRSGPDQDQKADEVFRGFLRRVVDESAQGRGLLQYLRSAVDERQRKLETRGR
jgi:hypothetical protein